MGLRVYVAGPISVGDLVLNVRNAIIAAERIRVRGHFPFVPHLTAFQWYFLFPQNHTLTADSWKHWNESWLAMCDILVRLPGQSAGSDAEVKFAREQNIEVFLGMEAFMDSKLWVPRGEEGVNRLGQ